MFNELGEPLGEEEAKQVMEELGVAIVKRGLTTPAIMFLEMNKPLTFLASQGMIVAMPFLAPIIGADRTGRYSRFFQDRENVEKLIQHIEELAEEQDRKERKAKTEPKGEITEEDPEGGK